MLQNSGPPAALTLTLQILRTRLRRSWARSWTRSFLSWPYRVPPTNHVPYEKGELAAFVTAHVIRELLEPANRVSMDALSSNRN